MNLEPIFVTARVTDELERLGVRYFIGGSLASTLHGLVRTTQDSDLIAELRITDITPFVQALKEDFYIDEEMILESVIHHSSFNIIHRESMFKVDIFIPKDRNFIKMQFSRARLEILSRDPEIKAFVSSAEDTLLAKLEWYRMGNEVSERQWRDVMGVMKVQSGKLDFEYLRHMAKQLQIEDLLERAIEQSG